MGRLNNARTYKISLESLNLGTIAPMSIAIIGGLALFY